MKRLGRMIGRRSSTRKVLFSSVAVTALLLVLHVFRIIGDKPQLNEKDSYMGQMAVKVKQLDEKDSNIGQMTVKVKQLDEKDSNIGQMTVKVKQLDEKDSNIGQTTVNVKQHPSGKLKYLKHIDRIKETNEVIKQAPTSGLPYFTLDQPYFEPEVMYDFPTSSSSPRIPHIIHQTYKTEAIPMDFQKNVQSFIRFNPNWTYMFWTDETARQLIQARYPNYLVVWDNYRNNINKADALRYFVLYEFGGIYADLDFECLRPLDPVTRKYAAIFPLEPFEHSAFRLKSPFLLNNAIIKSRPMHPFLKHMIANLPAFQALFEQLDVAGPCFVTTNFMSYNNFTAGDAYKLSVSSDGQSPYIYKGIMDDTDVNAVYIPNTHFFMNTLSTSGFNENGFTTLCLKLSNDSSAIQKRGCNELRRRKSRSIQNHFRFTYTVHHWSETYGNAWSKVERKYINIKSIVSEKMFRAYS